MRGEIISNPHPYNHPHPLLRRHRVNNPGQHQPGHRNEEGPEHFLYLLDNREDMFTVWSIMVNDNTVMVKKIISTD